MSLNPPILITLPNRAQIEQALLKANPTGSSPGFAGEAVGV